MKRYMNALFAVRLRPELKCILEQVADQLHLRPSELVRIALAEWLDEHAPTREVRHDEKI